MKPIPFRQIAVLVLSLALLSGCGGQRASAILSLQDVDCASCGAASVQALKKTSGVYGAAFDNAKVELSVTFNPAKQSPQGLRSVVAALGYQCVLGSGQGRYKKEAEGPTGADIKTFKKPGADFEIEAHLVQGKVTVFDFFAVWCGPCRVVDREMKEIVAQAADVAYRRIDIDQWESAIAKRYLGKVPELPYVVIYGKNGQLLEKISGLNLVRLRDAIETGRTR